MADSAAGTMKLVGGDPTLDFVNTVGGRTPGRRGSVVSGDKLEEYSHLIDWSSHSGVLEEKDARRLKALARRHPGPAAEVLVRAVQLREALHGILASFLVGEAPPARDLDTVNAELEAVRRHERLVPGPDRLCWQTPHARRLDSILWPIGRAATKLLTSEELVRLRRCGGEGCGWLFLDRSRNGRRRWCTMADCGNLSKVRRFRQRRRKGASNRAAPDGHRRGKG
jgi:predicted RNA-binding Zn ribbon-like protein